MRWSLTFLFLFSSTVAVSQALDELKRQLDSLLKEKQRSELIVGLGYGNNPAYSEKRMRFDHPVELKPFLSPSLTYYHKSGLFAGVSNYYLFNNSKQPWFEWDFTVGYDYTGHDDFLAGVSYTRYLYADSSDVPITPILNEAFAYFYYRKWWLQPGISVDMGWGEETGSIGRFDHTISGYDFNVIAVFRHPFIFLDVIRKMDVLLLTPSVGFTAGTAAYKSRLSRRNGVPASRCEKEPGGAGMNDPGDVGPNVPAPPPPPPAVPRELVLHAFNAFAPRALDATLSLSYVVGPFTFNPSYTLYRSLGGEEETAGYFSARLFYTFPGVPKIK